MAGVAGKSGRKSKAEEMGLQVLLDKCWKKKDREAVIRKLAEDCNSLDFDERHEARKLLMAYTFGKPKEKVEHSGNLDHNVVVRVPPKLNKDAWLKPQK